MNSTEQPRGDRIDTIYHTTEEATWRPESGEPYAPESMAEEGFIHACTWSQLPGVASRFFASPDGVVVLEIDTKLLPSGPVWEDLSGRGETFPHIYSAIPINAVTGMLDLVWDETGTPSFHHR